MAVIKVVDSKASIAKAINYITKDEKTEEHLITGKDCTPATAIDEMKATKEQWNKKNGRQYKHYIQSFDVKDKITPEKAHQIGSEWAEENFKGHEVLISTHTDKGHIHNHFIVNSVNYENGKKFQQSKKDLEKLKQCSDKICEREGISVIKEPSANVRYTQAEQGILEKGQLSWKDTIREAVDHERANSKTYEDFKKNLKQNHSIEVNDKRKYITYKLEGHKRAVRGKTLGMNYERGTIEHGFKRQIARETGQDRGTATSTRNTPNVDWSAIRDNVEDKGNRVSELSSNDVTGEIQRKVRSVKDRTDKAIGEDKQENGQPRTIQRDSEPKHENVGSKIKPKGRERGFDLER